MIDHLECGCRRALPPRWYPRLATAKRRCARLSAYPARAGRAGRQPRLVAVEAGHTHHMRTEARVNRWLLEPGERDNPHTGIDQMRGGAAWSVGNDVRPLVHGATYFAELLRCVRQ